MNRKRTVEPVGGVDQAAMKRLATQQSVQLPANYREAMAVLDHMRDIVMWQAGLVGPQPVIQDDETVVSLETPFRHRA